MAPIANLTVRLSAQIAEFQSDFKEATRSAEKFQSEFQGIATKASALGNIIAEGVSSAIGSLGSFAESILENAGHLTDLSQKTGLTTETLQRMQFAAEQTGASLDSFTNASFKLGANLAGGNKSVVAGVAALGLSFKDLQQLRPDEQFKRIAAALGEMENPQERNRIGLLLFGKTFKEIAPAIAEGYDNLANKAAVSSDTQIAALDAAGDAWARFKRDATTHATSFAGTIIEAGQALANSGFSGALEAIANNAGNVNFALSEMINKMHQASSIKGKDINLPMPPNAAAKMTDYVKALADARAELTGLTAADKAQIAAAQKMGAEQSAVAEQFGISEVALKLLTQQTKTHTKAVKEAVVVTSEMTQVHQLLESLQRHEASALQFATSAWRAWEDTVSNALSSLPRNPVLLQGRDLSGLAPQIDTEAITKTIIEPVRTSFLSGVFGGDFGARLGGSLMSAIQGGGNIFAAAAGTIGQAITSGIAKTITSGAGLAISGALGGVINALLPGVGALLGPLVNKITGLFDRNKGRDIVVDFAEGFAGGFDGLHKQLLELGDAGEQLWIKLTQGVGRNDKTAAQAAIDEVTKALAEQAKQQEESTVATQAGAEATIETATQASLALETLNDKIKDNQTVWDAWSEFVTARIATVANSIGAISLGGGGSGSGATPPDAGSLRSGAPNMNVTLRLPDNTVLLKQFVKGLQSEGLA